MKYSKQGFFYGSLLLLLGGCGSKPLPNEIYVSSKEEAKLKMSQTEVSCEKTEDCHPAVGLLVSYHQDKHVLSSCTGFLISASQIITNSHCIPKKIKQGKEQCTNLIEFFLPKSSQDTLSEKNYEEKHSCKKVLFSSEIEGKKRSTTPDYAIIELDSVSDHPPLSISRNGFSHKENLKIFKMQLNEKSIPSGSLKQESCTTIQGSLILPQFNHKTAPIVSLSGCHNIPGNSGAPIIDSEGKVRGIHYASLTSYGEKLFKQRWKTSIHTETRYMSFTTNLACIHHPWASINQPIASECEMDVNTHKNSYDQIHDFNKNSKAQILLEFKKWTSQFSSSKFRLIFNEPKSHQPLIGEVQAECLSQQEQIKTIPYWRTQIEINATFEWKSGGIQRLNQTQFDPSKQPRCPG
ncbi:MAG: hypothetical protein CL678_10230 [Bdellovibrionaceae bacterium]|nr:hypothetical protein [Pseudobdellovibrionaceae bacterium]|tara:strand:- start:3009 stop:4229 length:1221 start_codon:yes stop_codon:yes gene_type:complete